MQDRVESAAVILTAVAAGIALALKDFLAVDVGYSGQIFFLLLWAYSVFWAFSLSRLLSVRLYRNQALGVGLVALGWAAFNYSFILSSSIIPNAAYPLALLLTFFWIDSSVLASRKSDPLYRNTLHWRELRWVLWPTIVGAMVAWYVGLLLAPSDFLIILPTGIGRSPQPLPGILLLVMFFAVSVPGPVYLLAAALRSKDRTLRKHLRWFGLFAVWFFFFDSIGGLVGQPVFFGVAYVLGTYCLYRSAKSLAPLNRLPISGPSGSTLVIDHRGGASTR